MSKKRLIVLIDVIYVGLITALLLMRISPDIEPVKIEGFDKVVHFCFYFGLNILLLFTFSIFRKKRLYRHIISITFFTIIYSIFIEFLQMHTQRSFEYLDIAANSTGAIVSLIVFQLSQNNKIVRKIISD
ncbi:MAG: VanZ family protein [Rikenellaceae bacterium]